MPMPMSPIDRMPTVGSVTSSEDVAMVCGVDTAAAVARVVIGGEMRGARAQYQTRCCAKQSHERRRRETAGDSLALPHPESTSGCTSYEPCMTTLDSGNMSNDTMLGVDDNNKTTTDTKSTGICMPL